MCAMAQTPDMLETAGGAYVRMYNMYVREHELAGVDHVGGIVAEEILQEEEGKNGGGKCGESGALEGLGRKVPRKGGQEGKLRRHGQECPPYVV